MGAEPVSAGFGDRTVGRQFALSGSQGTLRSGFIDQHTAVFRTAVLVISCSRFGFTVPGSRHARLAACRLAPTADRSSAGSSGVWRRSA